MLVDCLDEEICRGLRLDLPGCRRQEDLAYAVAAMDKGGNIARPKAIRAGAGKNRNITFAQQLQEGKCIAHGQGHSHVAVRTGHTD